MGQRGNAPLAGTLALARGIILLRNRAEVSTQMIDPGYWIEPAVLSEKECEHLIAALSNVQRSRAGVRHPMRNPAIHGMASNDRLQALARKALGTEATPFRATLFEKSQERNWLIAWHQDTALPLASFFDAPGWG